MAKTGATSFDVAERAGVSQSTVSRALAKSPSITPATREKVEQAARELGYQVDMRAARLRSGRTGTIAVVVVGREGEDIAATNPFHYTLLGHICAAASARGHHALVAFQSDPQAVYADYLARREADSVIVIGSTLNMPIWNAFRELQQSGAPCAFWGSPFDDSTWVRSDNHAAGRLAAERLLAEGAQAPRFVGKTDTPQRQFAERHEGFCAALRESGIDCHPPVFADAPSREEQGAASVDALNDAADALFFACDAMALGGLARLSAIGRAVPGSIAVIGFDGLGSGAFSDPPLTTIEPDFAVAGEMLVSAVLDGVEGDGHARVPVRLVERASTG